MINARSSGSLHRQVRRMLVQCITIVLLLAMSVRLGIELHQESGRVTSCCPMRRRWRQTRRC